MFLAIIFSFFLFPIGGTRQINLLLQKEVDMLVQLYLTSARISGMGLSIVQNDGEILYNTGYGMADLEKNIPNGNSTQFLIASITKSFTSTVVVKVLHEKFPEMGEAVLDTPIRKLMPQVNFTLVDRFRSEQATFRDLLSHRLCLFRDDLQLKADPFSSTEEIMYRQRYNGEICSVRSDFHYNNQMFVIAGELIGILAGKPFKELAQDLLNDIGMVESAFAKASDDFSKMPNRSQPYYVMHFKEFPINANLIKRIVLSYAAGGLFLTPNDMAKYTRFRINLGKIDGKQVVPEECMRWMLKPSIFMPMLTYKTKTGQKNGNYYAYGMGLKIGAYDGWQHIHHGGNFPPYNTLMSLFPEKNLTIFTGRNMGPARVDFTVLHQSLFDLLAGNTGKDSKEEFKDKADAFLKSEVERKALIKHNLEALLKEHHDKKPIKHSRIIGKYGSGSLGDLEVTERFDYSSNSTGLYLTYGKWVHGWVEYVAGDLYKLILDTDIIQDNYATGSEHDLKYLVIVNDTIEFIYPTDVGNLIYGKFKLGVDLNNLLPVPWSPNSCGPA